MTCDELRPNAAGLAALPPADPERQAAEAHAQTCEACRAELQSAQRVILLLDRMPAPEPPSAEVLARVRAQIVREPRMMVRVLPFAAIAAFALLAATMHLRADEDGWMQALVLGAAAALFGITAALRGRLAIAVATVGSALFSITFATGGGAADATTGAHCMTLELIAAAIPLATTVALVMSKKASGGPAMFGAAAAVGALAGQAALHLACPVRSNQHLLIFHTGGIVAAIVVGLALSQLPRLKYSPAR